MSGCGGKTTKGFPFWSSNGKVSGSGRDQQEPKQKIETEGNFTKHKKMYQKPSHQKIPIPGWYYLNI